MARARSKGRGSPEAVEKRRSARALNTIFAQGQSGTGGLDGRTEKRRRRLIQELKEGRRGQPLKPIDVLTHASELFELGETLASLKKHGVKPIVAPDTAEVREAARRVQVAYAMPVDVFKLIGLEMEPLDDEGAAPARKRRKKA
ncbi:hypothetical protein [Sandaracinus amylolyticus]|uniref:hypothetical protein n=1 Tax=Sandaracinus amylolyticus TaxID=927083 RepID=UPI001F24A6EB|nr:hypothetical protein [Sandaracinus amylolyticus]UJR78665.1 Hypothetical protein I5071_6960 [Sandaracinus amylolyticus]